MRHPPVAITLALCAAACGAPSTPATPPPTAPIAVTAPPLAAEPSLEDSVKSLQAAALASTTAEATVRSLTTEVGARIAGGPKDALAVAWAKTAMQKAGLAQVRTEPVKVPHWERGKESVEITGPGGQPLHALGIGGTVGTGDKPIVGDVIEVASLAALAALDDASVRGKIVFFNATMRRAKNGAGYGESISLRFEGPKRAAEKGAIAAVIRSLGTDTVFPHTGAGARDAKVPGVALSGESAEALHNVLASKKRARLKISLGATWYPDADSSNVVGDLVGSEHPEEIVLMGAHLDSWDVGKGAIDDGAGVAIVLEAARVIAALGRAPKRTIRVVLFACEEIDATGGAAYAVAHAAELGKYVMLMEADIGTAKVYGARIAGGPTAGDALASVTTLLTPLGIEADTTAPARGGADLRGMMRKGVPAFDLEQDVSLYFDVHHTEGDTMDRIDPPGLAQSAAAYATAAWAFANGTYDVGRVPEKKPDAK